MAPTTSRQAELRQERHRRVAAPRGEQRSSKRLADPSGPPRNKAAGGRSAARPTSKAAAAEHAVEEPLHPTPAPTARPYAPTPARRRWWPEFSLEQVFVVFGFAVALSLIVLFGLDLATSWPCWRASVAWDVAAVVSGLVLAYLSWDAWRGLS